MPATCINISACWYQLNWDARKQMRWDKWMVNCNCNIASKWAELRANVRKESEQDRSHQWSTRPAHSPGRQWLFWGGRTDRRTDGRTDGWTLCVKIVITTGRDCGRPRGSKIGSAISQLRWNSSGEFRDPLIPELKNVAIFYFPDVRTDVRRYGHHVWNYRPPIGRDLVGQNLPYISF